MEDRRRTYGTQDGLRVADASGVEYFFTNTSDNGNHSGWQDNPIYEDTGLNTGTSYSYTVEARGKSVSQMKPPLLYLPPQPLTADLSPPTPNA